MKKVNLISTGGVIFLTRNFNLNLKILFSLLTLGFIGCSKSDGLLTSHLKCENLKDPLGINTLQPRFSWKNSSDRQEASQFAYQILVAGDIRNLNEEDADFWNSGKIESPLSVMVDYHGRPLNSGRLLFWKVRTWDEKGNVSAWSETAEFSVGLLEEEDWAASYIGFYSDNGFFNCPQMRKAFSVEKIDNNERFILHVNSLGYHEVFINGAQVNDHVLSPAVSQFNKRSQVVTYDVSSYVLKGQNNIIFWLGSGWYTKSMPGVVGDGPLVRAQLERVSGELRDIILATDESWVGRDSEYNRINEWIPGKYEGEKVEGNQENRNVAIESPDDLVWGRASVVEVPKHGVTPQMVEPDRIMDTINPINVSPLGDKTYLVDMGKNLTGWFEITFSELNKSQEVVMEYCDHLDEEGGFVSQNQEDRYIASGSGKEVFKNKFEYHGFRYVKISNLDKTPELNSMKAFLIHTSFASTSRFECSDPELNRIHDMVLYTLRCLSLGGYLVDCPHIEKVGYGGDGNASTLTAQTMFNMAPLYNNWLQAWGDVIRDDGSMPHSAPNFNNAGGGPYWCGFIISASWNTYQNYGDARILEKYYPVMQKWLEYVDKYTVDGLLKRWPDTDYRAWYLGDWAAPVGVDQTNEKSIDLVNNCYISICFDQMNKIAGVLGKPENSQYYLKKRDQLNTKIHETYFHPSNGTYGTGSQIDLVFPMLAGIVPPDLINDVINTLVLRTQKEYDYPFFGFHLPSTNFCS